MADERGGSVTDDLVVDARPALCWLDAFPWIDAAVNRTAPADGEPSAWWFDAIDASGTPQRAQRLAQLADLALKHLTRWTVGQIFPGLPADTVLTQLEMSTRARNALGRSGYRLAGDLHGLELGELLDLPYVGIGTVDSILRELADSSTLQGTPVLFPPQREDVRPAESWGGSLLDDLRLIASWYVALGTPDHPLLGGALAHGAPPDVIKAKQRLELITAGEVLDAGHTELDVAELLHRSISTLDSRAQQIVARRFFADEPETLDELGRSLGVTRERVRQIEAKARANMVGFLENSDTLFNGVSGDGLEMVAAAARELIGTVLPLDDLIALIPALARPIEAVGQPAWRVLDRLDNAYEIEDGWCASPTILAAQTMTLTRLQELANHHGVVAIDDLDALNPNQPAEAGRQSLRAWLSYCGYVLDGDYVFTRVSSVSDRAASILSVVGSPMASQDILCRLGVERSLGSLKNSMATDERFERVDRDQWALVEWGMESYGGVRALVRDEVARGGGRVALDTLIERITGKYSVTASSVVAYASAPPFEVKAGVVRMAVEGRDARKSPQRTRRLYRQADSWLYRIKVTKDHARGSGSVAPMAIAGILDLQYGQTCLLKSELGPQSINWTGTQPAFGTIRRFLMAEDVEVDSEIFLVIADDGTFQIEPVDVVDADPLKRALTLAGVTGVATRQQPRLALARAIGLAEDSSPASVISGYRERGDSDIAELLMTVRDQLEDVVPRTTAPSVDIDEILDLL
jgi:hypothetical protein